MSALSGSSSPSRSPLWQHSSWESEVQASRLDLGIVDTSHFSRLEATGVDRQDLLHRLSTNSLLELAPGEVRGTVLSNEKGRALDFLRVIPLDSSLLLVGSGGNEQSVSGWVGKFTITEDFNLNDITPSTVMASVIGPNAISGSITRGIEAGGSGLIGLPWGVVRVARFHTTRYDELYLVAERAHADAFWEWIQKTYSGVTRVGDEAYELYRIARGIPRINRELTGEYTPYDIGLTEFVDREKGCYIGQEVLARLQTYSKAKKRLMGVLLQENIEGGSEKMVVQRGPEEAGWITSISRHSVGGIYPALGVLRIDVVQPGSLVTVEDRSNGRVVELPMRLGGA
jgi:folate-binding protein YgfZ